MRYKKKGVNVTINMRSTKKRSKKRRRGKKGSSGILGSISKLPIIKSLT